MRGRTSSYTMSIGSVSCSIPCPAPFVVLLERHGGIENDQLDHGISRCFPGCRRGSSGAIFSCGKDALLAWTSTRHYHLRSTLVPSYNRRFRWRAGLYGPGRGTKGLQSQHSVQILSLDTTLSSTLDLPSPPCPPAPPGSKAEANSRS